MTIFLAIFLIFFESVPEALAATERKTLAGVFEFVYRAFVAVLVYGVLAGFHWNIGSGDYFWYHLGGYVLVRFAIFDYLYNVVANQPMFASGTTKLYDKFFGRLPWHLLGFMRAIALFIGIIWLLK